MNHWGKPRVSHVVAGDKTVAAPSPFVQTIGGRQMSKHEAMEKSRQNAKQHTQLKKMPVVLVPQDRPDSDESWQASESLLNVKK